MVERLKAAIEKARAEREAHGDNRTAAPRRVALPTKRDDAVWSSLPEFHVDRAHLERERVVSYSRDKAHVPFDLLRTRLLSVCRDRGWRRIGISSPTKGCGKSLICANLAFSVARHQDARAILIDLDLRSPRIAKLLGLSDWPGTIELLKGEVPVEAAFRRYGNNLGVCANSNSESHASELMQSASTAHILEETTAKLKPDLVICDLPPMLVVDDTVGFLSNLDAIMLVAAGGRTRAHQIAESERLIGDATAFLGVTLNMAEDIDTDDYVYDYSPQQ